MESTHRNPHHTVPMQYLAAGLSIVRGDIDGAYYLITDVRTYDDSWYNLCSIPNTRVMTRYEWMGLPTAPMQGYTYHACMLPPIGSTVVLQGKTRYGNAVLNARGAMYSVQEYVAQAQCFEGEPAMIVRNAYGDTRWISLIDDRHFNWLQAEEYAAV